MHRCSHHSEAQRKKKKGEECFPAFSVTKTDYLLVLLQMQFIDRQSILPILILPGSDSRHPISLIIDEQENLFRERKKKILSLLVF